ncbi:16S rRNA methyltransferase [Microbacterium mangrovi]|uniref:Ribosomal RNA small subunit methyltransferase E n=1 Tax=Microbacterium mangrovi TaxID=1348253 RepID=A0A0B2A5F3_9MICO|nr:16S rRNA (uracil(1498)-N(3))-methyltransferase [Microbacterium mangrovi]KHK98305.1 16S rRNA methyltransferase [Microbacterium mangrovi]
MALHFQLDELDDSAVGATVTLTGAEAHHAAAVRRVRVGEPVTVGNGRGLWLEGECTSVAPKLVELVVRTRTVEPAPAPRIVLAQALAKGDRDELAIQAATELGVDEVVPWQAARSVSRWDAAKAVKGIARWQTIVREAGKQAHRAWMPVVTGVVTTAALAERAAGCRMLVLEPAGDQRLTGIRFDPADARDIVLVVGPEGGIAPEELQTLRDAGASVVALGDTVLRTSTAGPAALAILDAALGRW